jgi:hypothetical protein
MTTRSLPNNEQALVTFIARKEEIDALLRRIQGASDHFNTHPDEVHWGMSARAAKSSKNCGRSRSS